MTRDNSAGEASGTPKVELGELIGLAKSYFNSTLGPVMAGREESAAIMKKHVLRSQAELLTGLLAFVQDEEKRMDKEATVLHPRGRQKVAID